MQTNIGLDEEIWTAAKKAAVDRRVSLARLVNEALNAYLKLGLTPEVRRPGPPARKTPAKKARKRRP